jgi:hypothetical protein
MKSTLLLLFSTFFLNICLQAQTIVGSSDTTICSGYPAVLHAQLINGSYGTSSYSFEQYTFSPQAFLGGIPIDDDFANCVNGGHDDCYAGPYNIGFNFCFFNQLYSQFWVGTNGWISFTDPTTTVGVDWTGWSPSTLPNPTAPINSIFSPWEDWFPVIGDNYVYYYLTGTAPTRKLVVYWLNVPTYSCQGIPGTFQIVINEQNSIIENHLQNKPICSFTSPTATQGVQNADGSVAFIAPGRNQTVWSANNESTRFVPSGIVWYTGGYPGGTIAGYGATLNVTPTATTTYTVVIETCNGGTAITKNITVGTTTNVIMVSSALSAGPGINPSS